MDRQDDSPAGQRLTERVTDVATPENAEPILARLERHGSPLPTPASDCRIAAAFLIALADGLEVKR